MDEWVTTRDAQYLKKVGRVQRTITRNALEKKIEAEKRGGKWWVKVKFNDNRWDLVYRMPPAPTAQAVIEQPPKETVQDARLREHFYQVAETAESLASRIQELLSHADSDTFCVGNIVDGIRCSDLPVMNNPLGTPIDPSFVYRVFVHYEYRFGKLPFGQWKDVNDENATQKLADNLVQLAHSADLKPCSKCPICREIAEIDEYGVPNLF